MEKEVHWCMRSWEDLSRDELYDAIQLRTNVFVVEQNCPYPECDDKDKESFHLLGYDQNKQLIAYLRVVKPGVSYEDVSIGRVVSAPSVRKSGIGRQLMIEGLSFIKKYYGPVPITISAQLYLQKFYEDFGFTVVGETYLEDDIPHIEMTMKYKEHE